MANGVSVEDVRAEIQAWEAARRPAGYVSSHVLVGDDGKTVVGGDAKSKSIAAASILAKVARDRLMVEMDGLYPGYGFASHKGYRAPVHAEALLTLGPCEIHRMAWGPVKLALMGKDPLVAFEDAIQDELPFDAAE